MRSHLTTLPEGELERLHREHQAGRSLRSIAREHWQTWGYASAGAALWGLRRQLDRAGLEIRDRKTAAQAASTTHGRAPRAAAHPDHPHHDQLLAHRRARYHETKGTPT
jgi:hypothetical protein